MKKVLLLLSTTTLHLLCIGQSLSISFDTSSQYIIIDTSAGNIWQVGTPTKCFFGDNWNGGKAIITDTVNEYSPNNISSFVFKLPFTVCDLCGVFLDMTYKLDADTLSDGGYIEYSSDGGTTWNNLNEAFGGEFFADTLFDGTPGITGLHKNWELSNFTPCFFSDYLLPEFRFVFKSDSIDNPRCGWIISQISATVFVCEGIQEINTNYHFSSVFPNPISNTSFLQIQNQNSTIKQVDFFDALGRKISTIDHPHQSNVPINKENFGEGIFFYRVELSNGQIDSGSFIVQ